MPQGTKLPSRLEDIEVVQLKTDILVIGAGNAGCFAAIEAKKLDPNLQVTLMEKAHIDRSGCLAAGMDAINTYIKKGRTIEEFVRWSRSQAGGLIREDLTISLAEVLNQPTEQWEEWGLPVDKDEDEQYHTRGKWDITIKGSEMKVILAEKVREYGCQILNRVVATNFLVVDGRIIGAAGFGVRDGKMYIVLARATIVSTGGCAGLYKPYTNDGVDSHHHLWYCPFNTGAGYAMGIRAGAEMTTFEMRWCATRTKDFNGPIDTISVGYETPMINAYGEKILQERYAHLGGDAAPRFIRANVPMEEWLNGRGPCYVDTRGMTDENIKDMKIDYLNERPAFVLYLAARGQDLKQEPIEIYGNDPYIVGGHTASGYWVDIKRATTLPGLFAAGDVAGGTPNKFVGGCAAEGMLAARGAVEYLKTVTVVPEVPSEQITKERDRVFAPAIRQVEVGDGITPREMEERMQRLMDEYAGGVHQFYRMNATQLQFALKNIRILKDQTKYLIARDLHELMEAHEVIDRLDVAEVLLHHLLFREETRWPGWQTRTDFPERNDEKFDCFVNSRRNPDTGEIEVFTRPYEQVVPGDRYLP
ncbi:FAD-dependent pyridine nucleotide-disulphide oxidoreductase [Moorella glycerini]|uniref:Succinate dehydrogenase flavoprotein subunit n=1 Tax=Neomoorella stamsii TaxID=1266720 RepID=A0A9X7P561_9FIRM|nr:MULTISPECIES: adenylyl-sulfate reductase subunit alpha [Moorella]PRR70389.1 Succinate dehydrogenase flavoprotein subunit [Moorella stamsii]CEP66394.1 FAD-dependent pyridine nucleotide-disulphide oxidoreductase [Moorella glycerini]